MIPVPNEEIMPYDVEGEKDIKYKDIIRDEISFIRETKNQRKIINSAKLVHNQKINELDIKYLDSCVSFKLLEEKCKEYKNDLYSV